MEEAVWGSFQKVLEHNVPDIEIFMDGVHKYFSTHPSVKVNGTSVIHSMKRRIKDTDHIKEKIIRKSSETRKITPENILNEVTDIAGLRILLLFQSDFSVIDRCIRQKVKDGDWVLNEKPKAFTWDPENEKFFKEFELDIIQRETSYTSVHYILKPRKDKMICCELQVRTLFEEIWGGDRSSDKLSNPHIK